MKNINLTSLSADIEKFVEERDWSQFHSVKNLACALSVESSELLEIFQWLKDEESNRIQEDPKLIGKVQDEVADIFVYLLRIVARTNIDLEAAVREKMRKNAEKYPVELAKGNAKKYNEF